MTDEKNDKSAVADFINSFNQFGTSETNNAEIITTEIVSDDELGKLSKQVADTANEVEKTVELTITEKTALAEFTKNRNFQEVEKYPKEDLIKHYIQGYESVDLVKLFPKTSIGGIVYLKTKDNWPKLRKEFLDNLEAIAKHKLALTKHRSISLLSNLINMWHDKIEKGLLEYMLTGDRKKLPPNFVIKGFKDYERFIKLLSKVDDVSRKVSGGTGGVIQAGNVLIDNSSNNNEYVDKKLSTSNMTDIEIKRQRSLEFFQRMQDEEEDKKQFGEE